MTDAPAPDTDPVQRLRAFWNQRYAAEGFAYGSEPNTFLVDTLRAHPLPAGAAALCLADGEGRNGVWLARQGLRVTSVDVAELGLQKARQLAAAAGVAIDTAAADVTRYELGRERWGAIVSIFLHLPEAPRRALHRRCAQALQPGGLFVFEAYGPGQLARGTGGPKEPALLHPLAALLADFEGTGLELLHRFEGVRAVHEGTLHNGDAEVVQLVLRRPAG